MKEIILKETGVFDSSINFQQELNAEQFAVVEQGDGPCLVLAGAGSGKTRTITYRVAYLLQRGIDPRHILLLTFTNKASKEMLARVESLLGSYPVGLWGGTFHSIANRILRQYSDLLGFTKNFTILDSDDAEALIKSIVKELAIDTSAKRFPSASKLNGIMSYARNAGITLRALIEKSHDHFFEMIPTIEHIAEVYALRKRQADSMDFDDLLVWLRDLLHQNPFVRDKLSTQFQYVLVDEYQDTNVLQAEIIRLLASVHKNVLVVGDDAQSIYSFRAAEIKNILSFPEQYQGVKTFRLVTNYRSTPEILTIANESISNNQHQFKKDLAAMREKGEKPMIVPAANTQQEAQFIAQQIATLRDDGMPLSEIAVLFRAAFHSQALEFELMRQSIGYEYRGGMKFFERAHVKDLLAYLRVKINPKDEVAWLRILGLQSGIGLVTAQKMIRQIHGFDSLAEIVAQPIGKGARATAGWKTLTKTLSACIQQEAPAPLIRIVASGEYRSYLEAEYTDFSERLEDIEQFALFAEQYKDLSTFLAEVSLSSEYGSVGENVPIEEDRLVLSTIHQAKGLEWDAVFLISLVDGKFPNGRALEEKEGIEEERRLFYVATTRARKVLYYTYPLVSGTESLLFHQPSMFLQELNQSLLEEVKLKRSITQTSSSWSSPTAWHDSDKWDDDEVDEDGSIELDEFGEVIEKKSLPMGGFLRDV